LGYEILAGWIIGAHGIQGAAKVKLATATALGMFDPGKRASEDEPRPTVDVSAKVQQPKGYILTRFVEAPDRTAIEKLIGLKIYAPLSRRAGLEADEYYIEDLIGIKVVTDMGRSLGEISQITANPASDIYETTLGALIPAIKEFVLSVDLAQRQILVRDIAGLLPEEQEVVEGEQEDQKVAPEPETQEIVEVKTRRRGRVGVKH
jgi:16S rRNA processing protein RimM